MNYYERYTGDYLRDTQHLSLAEHGAYTLLMDTYYSTEQPLPAAMDAIYRITRAMNRVEQTAVRRVCDGFFPVSDDGFRHHARIDREITKAQKRIDAAHKNGCNGGRPRKPNKNPLGSQTETHEKPTGLPLGSQTETQNEPNRNPRETQPGEALPDPMHHKPEDQDQNQKLCPAGAGRFAEFWAAFPRHEDRKRAEAAWRRKRLDASADAIIADVTKRRAEHRAWREGIIPHPTTYLNGERWSDDIDTAQPRHNGAAPHSAVPNASPAASRRLA